ncbi:MAG TPA: hypothetical protein PKA58_18750, partial [Polyangium sp.]|nr:hypothetical protein [Polyangium sp.]
PSMPGIITSSRIRSCGWLRAMASASGPLEAVVTLPEWFDVWFAKGTANHPDDRFQRATEAMAEFKEQYAESGPQSFRVGPRPRREMGSSSDLNLDVHALQQPEVKQSESKHPEPKHRSEISSTTRKPVEMEAPPASLRTAGRSRWVAALVGLSLMMTTIAIGLALKMTLSGAPPPFIAQRAFSEGLPKVPEVKPPPVDTTAAPTVPASASVAKPEEKSDVAPQPPSSPSSVVAVPGQTSAPTAVPTGKTTATTKTKYVPPGSID